MKSGKLNNLSRIILIFIFLFFIGYILYMNKVPKESEQPNNNKEKEVNDVDKFFGTYQKLNEFTYALKNERAKSKEAYYKLNDDYTIKIVNYLDDASSKNKSYDIYVNDKFILNDTDIASYNEDVFDITFYEIGGFLVYINADYTDIRSEHAYVIDKSSKCFEIYELENIKGMVPAEISFSLDKIVIKGTRFTHGSSIIYGESNMDDVLASDRSTWKKFGVTEDTIVFATYTYNVENNKLNLEPVVSDKVSLKEYIEDNLNNL